MPYDWEGITSLAYLTLIELKLREFPIPLDRITCEGVEIVSYQVYSQITGTSIEEITCGYEFEDAFLLKNIRPGLSLILYNDESYDRRLKHTLWHEIGHVKRGHKKHGDKEEIEAHFFAAQANAPNVLIKELALRGYTIDVPFIMQCFGLSEESARKKQEYLNKHSFNHSNQHDDLLLCQFSDYINSEYPILARSRYSDDYFDELEKERQSWH